QTPAPVKNVNVSPSDYSARVTWELPTAPQDSSYVTHYLIYLNNKFVKEISRAMYGTEFNILPLKPNTENTFGILTKADGSVQRGTYVNETFTTKQAERFTYGPISYSSLTVTISKPPAYIKEVMVIVQIASDNPRPVESLNASDLKPYQANTQDPYITAYLKTDALPLAFVIGDGKEYNSEKQKYFNQPLKQNSSYIAFLRFFETQNSYYSTKWSTTTRTFVKPPDKACSNDTSCGTEWYIVVVTLVSGIIIGIFLSYIVSCSRRKFRRRTQPQSNHEPKTTEADTTYQELDLTKLNTEDNYQSLRVNAEEESTYTELNQTRDVEPDNYQSLT
ncbi:---NA---, partial [Paramuricea clavata]